MTYLYLTPMLGGPGAPRYPIEETPQLIGRTEQAHIPLFEPTVSRRHATVSRRSGTVTLEDLGSKHGTFVNSRRISKAKLKVGDIVVFGLSLVLRLEETDQLVPPVEPLTIPSTAAEFVESGDDQLVTAIRDPDILPRQSLDRSKDSVEMSLQGQLSKARQLAETGAVCNSMLPEAYVRLNELRENLRHSVGEGVPSVDPYPILASVDSVLSVLDQILASTEGGSQKQPKKQENPALRRVVEQAIKRASAEFASRGVKFLAEIPKGLRVVGETDLLIKAVAWLLNRAGRVSPGGNPVQIIATQRGDEAVLTVSYLGREQRDGVGEGGISNRFRSAQEIVSSVGGTLTVESKPNVGSTVRVTLPLAG